MNLNWGRCVGWLIGLSIGAAPGSFAAAENADARRTLLVLGDSLTAGYGVDPDQAYPALLQKKINAARLPYEVVNAGVSGDTTAGGLRRLGWVLRRPVEVMIIALGGNDGLRGILPEATRSNLVSIIDTVRARFPETRVLLAGMQMPPNMGDDYVAKFRAVFPAVAKEKSAVLIPHLLEGVGGVPLLNQADQIHPNPGGHQVLASNVWSVLEPVLKGAAKPGSP